MAVPIFRTTPQPDTLSTGIGQGLSSILEGLAQGKVKQLQGQQFEQAGLPAILAQLDPQVQAAYLRQYGAAQEKYRKEQLENLGEEEIQNSLTAEANIPQEVDNAVEEDEISSLTSLKESPLSNQKIKIDALEQRLQNKRIPTKAREKIRERFDKEKESYVKQRNRAFDKTQEIRSEITDNAQRAQEIMDVVERNLELVKSGNMNKAGTIKALENLGLDTSALLENDTQEFIKNNSLFLKDLKSIFGGRISNSEMNAFMKGVANEYQSPEGQRRILESFKKAASAGLARFNAMDKIIDAHGGIPTETLKTDIQKVVGKDLQKIKKDYLKELRKKPLEAAESKTELVAKELGSKALSALPGFVGNLLKSGGKFAVLSKALRG